LIIKGLFANAACCPIGRIVNLFKTYKKLWNQARIQPFFHSVEYASLSCVFSGENVQNSHTGGSGRHSHRRCRSGV
jgi:hypothetical protein